jgi:hypothetical protein
LPIANNGYWQKNDKSGVKMKKHRTENYIKNIKKIYNHATSAILMKNKDYTKHFFHAWRMHGRITPEIMLRLIEEAGHVVTHEDEGSE